MKPRWLALTIGLVGFALAAGLAATNAFGAQSALARVNGEAWRDGSSATARWRLRQVIARIDQSEKLYRGEVTGSGPVVCGQGT